eukprot:12907618-Alexandrium_andersonii.AAC.1
MLEGGAGLERLSSVQYGGYSARGGTGTGARRARASGWLNTDTGPAQTRRGSACIAPSAAHGIPGRGAA